MKEKRKVKERRETRRKERQHRNTLDKARQEVKVTRCPNFTNDRSFKLTFQVTVTGTDERLCPPSSSHTLTQEHFRAGSR